MLAHPMEITAGSPQHSRLVANDEWIAHPKLDGVRCTVRVHDGTITARSRTDHPLELTEEQAFQLVRWPGFWDGELFQREGVLVVFDAPLIPGFLRDRVREIPFCNLGPVRKVAPVPKRAPITEWRGLPCDGIVLKHSHSRYPTGRTAIWLKVKR